MQRHSRMLHENNIMVSMFETFHVENTWQIQLERADNKILLSFPAQKMWQPEDLAVWACNNDTFLVKKMRSKKQLIQQCIVNLESLAAGGGAPYQQHSGHTLPAAQ